MNRSQVPHLSSFWGQFFGTVVASLIAVAVASAIGERNFMSFFSLAAIVIGIVSGVVTLFLLKFLSGWLQGWDNEWRERRVDQNKLKGLQVELYYAQLNLGDSLFHDNVVPYDFNRTHNLDSELLQLSITLPDLAPDIDAHSAAEEWHEFYYKLYQYARDGDIRNARRLGRLTRRLRLRLWCREQWLTIQGHPVARRLRSIVRRSPGTARRRRGRRGRKRLEE